ncbi:adenosylcobinamide-GDP ribazoletransferase [Tessaracoccus rhinocerotis]|uniref:adenosylcobinamide-GDP ribazoletransferase n=1 Tax=Tessaracoccus rhinocerotis TaxID=1689449 RepID=UPI001FECFF8A|nr:adenosylcobinamide-GDP ribazoletransferase [Tessaracoccus rhinocerotis]
MRALLAALGTFTVLPAPHTEIDRDGAGRMMAALPWVGLVVGGLAALVVWLTGLTGAGWLPAVLGVAALAVLTGALHLDGVADTADGLGSRRPAVEALAVMRRSDIGPMGVVTVLFVLLLDVAALASLAGSSQWAAPSALAAAAMVGRLGVVHASGGTAARSGGFGALFTGVTSPAAAVTNTVAVLLVSAAAGLLADGWRGAAVFAGSAVAALAAAWLWHRHLDRRLGGMTGDTFGSLVELGQAVFLVLTALAAAIPR